MPDSKQIQKLVELRTESLKHALETRDANAILSWHAPESNFTDPLRNVSLLPYSSIAAFYAVPFANLTKQTIISSTVTAPTPDFQAWEIVGETVAGVDDYLGPGIKRGEKIVANLASLIWWKWKGEGEAWDGRLEEEQVRGWKIVKQVDYCVPRKLE